MKRRFKRVIKVPASLRGQETTRTIYRWHALRNLLHCSLNTTLKLCNIMKGIFSPHLRCLQRRPVHSKPLECDFARHSYFYLKQKTPVSCSLPHQRSRFDSLVSRWFLRSWKTSVKKCGSAFSCSILALILLMIRRDVSQKTSLFASIMNGLSG